MSKNCLVKKILAILVFGFVPFNVCVSASNRLEGQKTQKVATNPSFKKTAGNTTSKISPMPSFKSVLQSSPEPQSPLLTQEQIQQIEALLKEVGLEEEAYEMRGIKNAGDFIRIIEKLVRLIGEQKGTLIDLAGTNVKLNSELGELEATNRRLDSELSDLKKKFNETSDQNTLHTKIQELNEKNGQLMAQLQNSEAEVLELKRKNEQLNNENSQLKTQLDELQNSNEQLLNKIDNQTQELNEKNDQLKTQLDELQSSEKKVLVLNDKVGLLELKYKSELKGWLQQELQKLEESFSSMQLVQKEGFSQDVKESNVNRMRFLFLQQLQVQRKFLLKCYDLRKSIYFEG
ncbi:MAG: hypothetical protein CfP315_0075 [Candidatus Improbicoccus pseudotrichonymphae]|uniref:Chromosome partition protein Smc n=1 Tax=Candidatus Improbicoccus pseudotrichonymphae TaxID=3033792 RepID=A0AA48HUG8_9FIRM|nr:MAG: hypothetical protein CfP315_0075 [Candidatus Improbicoccus pseudotrichonymphae]